MWESFVRSFKENWWCPLVGIGVALFEIYVLGAPISSGIN